MKHVFEIEGMSCNGCRSKVEDSLNSMYGVSAKVTLKPPIAEIEMEEHISVETFQKVLTKAGAYKIGPLEDKTAKHVHQEHLVCGLRHDRTRCLG